MDYVREELRKDKERAKEVLEGVPGVTGVGLGPQSSGLKETVVLVNVRSKEDVKEVATRLASLKDVCYNIRVLGDAQKQD